MRIINIDNKFKIDVDKVNMIRVPRGSGKYLRNNYIIDISDEIKQVCWDFSQKIILGKNQYDRMLPEGLNDEEISNLIRIQRTYCGKIGEFAFLICCTKKGFNLDTKDMLTIFEGESETDQYDFITRTNERVDVKASFRNIHKNLVVNLDQITKDTKDYYVGVKLNAVDFDSYNKLIDPNSITEGELWGFAEGSYMNGLRNSNLGEAACKVLGLERTMYIDKIINKF